MKKYLWVLGFLFLLVITAAAGLTVYHAVVPQRWEYATFGQVEGYWQWAVSNHEGLVQRTDKAGQLEFYKSLGGVTHSANSEVAVIDVLNVVGSKGWELVQTVPVPAERPGTLYVFKRPK